MLFSCSQKEEEKFKLIHQKNVAIANENKIQKNISKEQVNLGRYQSEENQNQNNVQKQNVKIIELGNAMQINCKYLDFMLFLISFYTSIYVCLVPDLTEFNRTQVISNLSNGLNSMNDKLEFTLKEHREIETKLQSNIDSMRVEKAKLDQEIKIKEKQMLENTSEIKKFKRDIEQVILIYFINFKLYYLIND